MPAYKIKDRLLPYKLLAYLLYSPLDNVDWAESVDDGIIRVYTGPMSRAFRIKISQLWETIFWLEEKGLIEKVKKEKKRGTAVVQLRSPTNIV